MTALPTVLAEGLQFHSRSLPWIHLAWLAPALFLLYLHSFYRKRVALRAFASAEVLRHLIPSVSRGRQYGKCAMVLGAVLLLSVGIARPQWGTDLREIRRQGIDLVVLLDLSKSMLAEDVPPSRLEWARADLKELLGGLTGDRVGLVAFAGRAEVRCPLTFDYGFFRRILDDLKVGSVGLGGTNLSAAIHRGLDCFQDQVKNHKALLLITDGEDHEAYVKEAAEKARERGVRIFSIGVGDTGEGKRIPLTDDQGNRIYLKDREGREVWSRMDPRVLLDAAQVTDGGYAPAYHRKEADPAGGVTTVRDIYLKVKEKVARKELEGAKEERYKDRFQWFLGAAFALLAVEPLVRTRKRAAPASTGARRLIPSGATAAAFLAALLLPVWFPDRAGAGEFERLIKEGNRLLSEGNYVAAEEKYLEAKTDRQDAPEVPYNIANSYFLREDFPKAIELYEEALREARDRELELRIRYNRACAQARQSEKFVSDLSSGESLEKGVELLRQAIGGFRDALEIEPAHQGAQANLAIAQLRIKNLLDHQKRLREEAEKKKEEEEKDQKDPREVLKELIAEEKAEIELTREALLALRKKDELSGRRERLGRLAPGPGWIEEVEGILADPGLEEGAAEIGEARKLAQGGDVAGAARKIAEAGERLGAAAEKQEGARSAAIEKDRADQEKTMSRALGLASSLRGLAEGKGGAPAGQTPPGPAPVPVPGPVPGPPPPEIKERLTTVAGLTEDAAGRMGEAVSALGSAGGQARPEVAEPAQVAALEHLEKALAELEKLPPEEPPPPEKDGEKKEEKKDRKDGKDKKEKDEGKKDEEKKDGEKKDGEKKDGEKKARGKEEKKKDEMTREEAEQALRKFQEKDAQRRKDRERRAGAAAGGRAALDKDW